jgi:hypothetical protein
MVHMGRCDMCAEIRVLHLCGEFLICDPCEKSIRGEEE